MKEEVRRKEGESKEKGRKEKCINHILVCYFQNAIKNLFTTPKTTY
jgi:hypothetical protein